MATSKLAFRPGINKQLTLTLNEGGWSDGNLMRFRDGLPQPIGGWIKTLAVKFRGACRKMHAWVTLGAVRLMALGTNSNLYLALGDTLYDITPVRASVALTNPFTTVSGSSAVTLTATAHGAAVGDQFVTSAASVGGLALSGTYLVATVPSPNILTFAAEAAATSSSTGGGSVAVKFLISPGNETVPFSSGWGVGGWSLGAWGTDRAGLAQAGSLRLWSLDHWGEELVACIRDGGIYNWKPASTYSTRAALIPNAPAAAKGVFTAMPERHLIAFGAEVGGVQDPMLVRWSDVEDYTVWTATATNSAGSYRIVGGSQIMSWAASTQEILIWTDTVLWAMRFEGLPYVYGFFQQGKACGLIAPNAAVVMNGTAYWMGRNGFFQYAGRVQSVPCPVWDTVFKNLNPQQAWKVHCGQNVGYSEATWFYPSMASQEIDSYVTLNPTDGTWTIGKLCRTAWEDAETLDYPSGAGMDGQIYAHEFGTDADGAPLNAFVESGYLDIADGAEFMALDQVIPDFADQTGAVLLTVRGRAFPNGSQTIKGPFAMSPSTRMVTARMRARQIAIRLEVNSLGAFFRLGAIRARSAPNGRKG